MSCKRVVLATTSLLTLALVGVACDDASAKQRKAEQAQLEADQKKGVAEQQAQEKTVEARDAAQYEMNREQRTADQARSAALAALDKEKNDYQTTINKALDEVEAKVKDLRPSMSSTAPSYKATREVIDELVTHRDILRADARSVGLATGDTWAGVRAKVDADVEASRPVVKSAELQIKSLRR